MTPAFQFGLLGLRGIELLLAAGVIAFWLWMMVDCSLHERGSTKLLWMIFIMCSAPVGALGYLLLRKLPRVTEP